MCARCPSRLPREWYASLTQPSAPSNSERKPSEHPRSLPGDQCRKRPVFRARTRNSSLRRLDSNQLKNFMNRPPRPTRPSGPIFGTANSNYAAFLADITRLHRLAFEAARMDSTFIFWVYDCESVIALHQCAGTCARDLALGKLLQLLKNRWVGR